MFVLLIDSIVTVPTPRVQDSHSGAHALIEEIARKSKAQRTSRILE